MLQVERGNSELRARRRMESIGLLEAEKMNFEVLHTVVLYVKMWHETLRVGEFCRPVQTGARLWLVNNSVILSNASRPLWGLAACRRVSNIHLGIVKLLQRLKNDS